MLLTMDIGAARHVVLRTGNSALAYFKQGVIRLFKRRSLPHQGFVIEVKQDIDAWEQQGDSAHDILSPYIDLEVFSRRSDCLVSLISTLGLVRLTVRRVVKRHYTYA